MRGTAADSGTTVDSTDDSYGFRWLVLRGRCADCAAPISVRYPAVELATAVLFVAVTVRIDRLGLLEALLLVQASGHAPRDAVQPGTQRRPVADRAAALHQHEKGGLRGVVDVRHRAQPRAAGGAHGRPVAQQERLEGSLVVVIEKAGQQLPVRAGVEPDKRRGGPEHGLKPGGWHGPS